MTFSFISLKVERTSDAAVCNTTADGVNFWNGCDARETLNNDQKFVERQKFIFASRTLGLLFECIQSTMFLFWNAAFSFCVGTSGVGVAASFVAFSDCEIPCIISITILCVCM